MLLNRHFYKIVKNETYARANIWLLFSSEMIKFVELGIVFSCFSIKGAKFGSNILNKSNILFFCKSFFFHLFKIRNTLMGSVSLK